jgi:hypothetical protein
MLSTALICFLQVWNTFDRVGIPLYEVGMLWTLLEYLVRSWNAFCSVDMLSRGLACFL